MAGIELIFFTVTSIGLCSGFVLKRVLTTQECSVTAEQGLHRVRAFPASQPTPPLRRLTGTRNWEGTQPGQLAQTAQRDALHHMAPCSVYKPGESWPRITARGLPGHHQVGGEQVFSICITCFLGISLSFFFFLYYYYH